MKVHYFGHSGISLENKLTVLIDPWLNDNPLAKIKAENIIKADYIIATHNHFDHVNDIPIIAKNTGATVIGIVETADELASKGCEKTIGCNIGGKVKLKGIELVFTQAFHSMSSNPSGVIIFLNNKTIYHAGDTGVFGDMKLIGEMCTPSIWLFFLLGDTLPWVLRKQIKRYNCFAPKQLFLFIIILLILSNKISIWI